MSSGLTFKNTYGPVLGSANFQAHLTATAARITSNAASLSANAARLTREAGWTICSPITNRAWHCMPLE